MCESTHVSRRDRPAIPRPRWGRLYGVASLGVVGLAVAEVVAPAVAQSAVETLLALVTLVAIALWIRANRVALEQQAWCECAADTVSVRVVAGRRPTTDAPAAHGNGGVAEDLPRRSVIEKERPARVLQHAGRD